MDAETCLGTDTLLAFVEGRATHDERAAIERHASRCDDCRRVLSSLARGASSVSPAEAPTLPAAADALDELAPGDRVSRYVVRARLGSGGMGVVYAARDPELGRDVAIKLLRASPHREVLEQRLHREARALAQLAHPNVVAIHDVGRVGERLFIAMELIDGETLARWTRSAERSPHQVLAHYLAAGRGLAAAHAAGIVHRDVKPENIMLGKDGRVRVVDFGLARTPGADEAAAGETPSDAGLTSAGAAMGTPHYMAPEQHRGEDADARSDQFAFAAAVYYALYGERPFAGDTLESLAANVEAGAIREPARRRGVPRRIWRALRRAMSPRAADRFATLDELLARLAPSRGIRWLPVAAGAALAIAAGVVVLARPAAQAPCEDMATHLAGVWDAPRRAALVAALPSPTAQLAIAQLDAYAVAWVAERGDVCAATRVRGDQTEQAMGVRLDCLDDELRDLGAVVDRLAVADPATARHAVSAIEHLGAPAACLRAKRPGKPPGDPALVANVRGKLASARAQHWTGHPRDGVAIVAATATDVAKAAYRPLEAEAALLDGILHNDIDDAAGAVAALERADLAAEACGDDEVAVRALTQLVYLHGEHAQFANADATAKRAAAALERIGGDAELAANLDYAIGDIASFRGDLAGAKTALDRALREAEAAHAELRIASTLVDLAQLELRQMHAAAAEPYLTRALAIQERLLGPEHPDLAKLHVALGGAAYERDDYDGAATQYERAIAILEHSIGRDNVQVANALDNLALARQWQDRIDDALAEIREAVAIDEKVLPASDPETAAHLITEANILEQLHRPADALPVIDRALAMLHTLYGDRHQDIADALEARADIELHANHLDAALADARASLAMFDATNPTYPTEEIHVIAARAQLALHRPADALVDLDAARAHRRPGADPFDANVLDALYGRALIEANRDRTRGIALVTAAYSALRADPRAATEAHDLAAFMRAQHIAIPP